MADITAELVKKLSGEVVLRRNLWPIVEVTPNICNDSYKKNYDVVVTIRDPWTYKAISSGHVTYHHLPTGTNYAWLIANILQIAHPNWIFTWDYNNWNQRVVIEYEAGDDLPFARSEKKPWQEVLKEKENNTMRFTKVIVNGPATIAWVTTGRNPAKKVVIKKAYGDSYDLEKAMLMCWAKSWFSDDTDFHKWFRLNMKMFKEAYDKDHPDIGELPVVDAAAISKNINASLERMSKALHNYKDRLNSVYGKAAVGDNIVNKKDDKKLNIWSEDEVHLLKRRYKTSSISNIAAALGRSEAAVKAKARRMGLDKE